MVVECAVVGKLKAVSEDVAVERAIVGKLKAVSRYVAFEGRKEDRSKGL